MAIPFWTASLAKRGLWKTLRCICAWVFGAVLVFGVGLQTYRVESLRRNALEYSDLAKAQAERAKRLAASAGIATKTRAGMDQVQFTVNLPAEEAARRIEAEAYANPDPAAGRPDPDIVRQLEEAEARVRSASHRLQRADPR